MSVCKRLFLLPFITILLIASLNCSGGQGRVFVPLSPSTESANPLPLQAVWVKILIAESDEDRWRPMQYSEPVLGDGMVFLGNTESMFYAFDSFNGDIVWSFKTAGPVESGAVYINGKVVFGDSDGLVYCLEARTGKLNWKYRVQGQVMGKIATNGQFVYIHTNHERLYAVNLADGKWKWMQPREIPVSFSIRGVSSPVVDGDRVLMGFADGYFFGFNAETGMELFKTLLQKSERLTDIDSTPLVENDKIYIASYGGAFYCLNREDASIQWTFNKGSIHRAAVSGDMVFVSDDEGFVHALNGVTGQEIWSFDIRENDLNRSLVRSSRRALKIPSSPIIYNDVILVASSDGYLYGLDRQSGEMKWRYWPGYGITSNIVADGNKLYVHSNFGNLYCLKSSAFFQ